MAKIYNSDVTKGLANGCAIQQNVDKTPNELAEKIVPTFETNPQLLRRIDILKQASATNATSSTIYTTPTNADFYLVACSLSLEKDVTATSITSRINAVVDGAAVQFLGINGITLTPIQAQRDISFPIPIKIDRGTNITVTNSTNVGNVLASGNIYGYLVYNPNA